MSRYDLTLAQNVDLQVLSLLLRFWPKVHSPKEVSRASRHVNVLDRLGSKTYIIYSQYFTHICIKSNVHIYLGVGHCNKTLLLWLTPSWCITKVEDGIFVYRSRSFSVNVKGHMRSTEVTVWKLCIQLAWISYLVCGSTSVITRNVLISPNMYIYVMLGL